MFALIVLKIILLRRCNGGIGMNAHDLAKKYKMLSVAEVDLIKACVSKIPSTPVIVNIGANVGTSVCAMLEANPRCFIFSCDKKPCPEERENLVKCSLPANQVLRILGDSTQIFQRWPGYEVDMVFVDGSHTVEDVTKDIGNWKLFTRQFILIHDYQHPNYIKDGRNLYDETVNKLMRDWKQVGQARYLVAFERTFTVMRERKTREDVSLPQT